METLSSRRARLSAGLFVCISVGLLLGAIVFLIIKKGTFAEYIQLRLSSESATGLSEGMPLTYSGFEIGSISEMELNDDGLVIIDIDVPVEHEARVNAGSRFFLEKPVIGVPKLFVVTKKEAGPRTPPAAKQVFQLEVVDEFNGLISKLPVLTEKISRLAVNLESITADSGALNQSLLENHRTYSRFDGTERPDL